MVPVFIFIFLFRLGFWIRWLVIRWFMLRQLWIQWLETVYFIVMLIIVMFRFSVVMFWFMIVIRFSLPFDNSLFVCMLWIVVSQITEIVRFVHGTIMLTVRVAVFAIFWGSPIVLNIVIRVVRIVALDEWCSVGFLTLNQLNDSSVEFIKVLRVVVVFYRVTRVSWG